MDKERFGAFIAEKRKALNMTQKDLADRLMISDKAVSKWERGLSFPDITLIEPLAHILSVSLTELMEGRDNTVEDNFTKEEVDEIIKKTVEAGYEEKEVERKLRLGEQITAAVLLTLITALEMFVLFFVGINWEIASIHMFTVVGLALMFGIYFWVFIKGTLPAYYDEKEVTEYKDGLFAMNVPGVSFNNSNWKHIVNGIRIWSAVVCVGYPILTLILDKFVHVSGFGFFIYLPISLGAVFTVFIVIYRLGKKYG